MSRKAITVQANPGYLPVIEKFFRGKAFLLLNSNYWPEEFEQVIAADSLDDLTASYDDPFESLKEYHNTYNDWLFGYFSYDLKNRIENLKSNNQDSLNFPDLYFFRPKFLMFLKKGKLEIHYHPSEKEEQTLYMLLKALAPPLPPSPEKTTQVKNIRQKISKEEYLEKIKGIKSHIQRGDIYEVNFCQEFYKENAELESFQVYCKLNEVSPMPFSCYLHHEQKHLLCASPERYLKKKGNRIFSQPIKGTIRRGKDEQEDQILVNQLKDSQKEQSENVMIVDLVRNDLSRTANRGSVKVDELFGIRSFRHVHQMISSVSSELKPALHFTDAIKTTFPMGSMTGAPKIKAMEIIENFETSKRGLFSGATGYITPDGDFDFNVVIRSILYNAHNKYLSFMVGGAITIHADPEQEYEECMLKAKAIFNVLGSE